MHATPLEMKIQGIVAPSLEAAGYAVVRLRVRDSAGRGVLEVVAERSDGRAMGVDDCTEISHTVSALLDVADPIKGPYDLEVSSPGLDRPLVSLADFTRFAGKDAKVELMLALDGRKRFRGTIMRVQGNEITLLVDGAEVALNYESIRSAKLAVAEQQAKEALKRKKKTG